jgi:hypothetical protein
MLTYTAVLWVVISVIVLLSALCAMKLKRKLSAFGVLASLCVFAVVAIASLLTIDTIYKFCLASGQCLKLTGDEEYSALIPLYFCPVYWIVFIVVNHFKIAFSKKD